MERIDEEVSVVMSYNKDSQIVVPRKMQWKGREYIFTKLGYHHAVRQGRKLFHYFHVTDGKMDFRLFFDTENLHWILEYISHDS